MGGNTQKAEYCSICSNDAEVWMIVKYGEKNQKAPLCIEHTKDALFLIVTLDEQGRYEFKRVR